MSPEQQTIPLSVEGIGETTATPYGGEDPARPCFILAHGAGAGQHHPFIVQTSTALATRGINVLTFNFLYMQRGRGGPDRPPVLEATWRAAIRCATQLGWGATRLVIGGKSMGGRIASMVVAGADAQPLPAPVHGLVLLGYPLHPPGKPDKLRVEHLPALTTPTLIVQGERDEFGSPAEVRRAFEQSPAHVDWLEIPGGDHSFKIRRSAGRTQADVQSQITDVLAKWILG
jgi:predicted alpha/beta-hydrolase family hydrolase